MYNRESSLPLLVDDGTDAYLHEGGTLNGSDGQLSGAARSCVRGVRDEAGDVVGSSNYDVYGEVRASSGVSTLFRYTGEQLDGETGLTYLRARYLNPTLSRFINADTVSPNAPGTQGYNLYAYVANNPTTWVDPSGHEAGPIAQLLGLVMANPVWWVGTVTCGVAPLLMAPTPSLSPAGAGSATASSSALGWLEAACQRLMLGVSGGLIACALTAGCFQTALSYYGIQTRFGSGGLNWESWTWNSLKDAADTWPKTLSSDDRSTESSTNTGSGVGSAGTPDPCNWLGLQACDIKFNEHVFEAKHNLNLIGKDQAAQKAAIEGAIRGGNGSILEQYAIAEGPKTGVAYTMQTTIGTETVEIRFTVWASGEVEVGTAFVIPPVPPVVP